MDIILKQEKGEKIQHVVFHYTEFSTDKIGFICERDRLFQQYIDCVKSIEAWSNKLPTKSENNDCDENRNLRRNKARVLENLNMNKDLLSNELLKLDLLISPFTTKETEKQNTTENENNK